MPPAKLPDSSDADFRLRPIKPLADEIAAELREREAQKDASAPYFDNGYLYERRFADGAQYPVIVRCRNAPESPEEIVLDIAVLAAGHPYYRVNRWEVSPDGARVAFAVDLTAHVVIACSFERSRPARSSIRESWTRRRASPSPPTARPCST